MFSRNKYSQSLLSCSCWLAAHGLESFASNVVIKLAVFNKEQKKNVYKKYFSVIKDINLQTALKFGQYVVDNESDPKFMRVYSTRLLRSGRIGDAIEIEKEIIKTKPDEIAFERVAQYDKNELRSLIDYVINKDGISAIDKAINNFVFKNTEKVKFIKNIEVDDDSFDRVVTNDIVKNKFQEFLLNRNGVNLSEYKYINQTIFFALKDLYPQHAIQYGECVAYFNATKTFKRYLANCYFRIGKLSKSIELLSENEQQHSDLIERYLDLNILRKEGFHHYPEVLPVTSIASNKKVTYLLHNALPYFSGGYATRSNGIIGGIKDNGWDIEGVCRLGFPNDTHKGPANSSETMIHGINYRLLINDDINVYKTPIITYLKAYGEALAADLKNNPPAIIHGASFFMNGIAGVYAAKALGCKSVYEVRGLQELSKISRHGYWENSEHYDMYINMEAQAAKDADAVFTLTQALKDEFQRRGVPAEKMTVLPNGVHSDRFKPKPKSNSLANKIGLENQCVIGFVGSFVDYEGLDLLLNAANILKKECSLPFHLLLVGDGAYWQESLELSASLGLNEFVTFTGRVPHDEVEDYYSLIDICPFPRKALPVCEMVSPLKPFEAMAMGKAVVSSDVAALAEIVQDGITGLLHQKDSSEDLASKLQQMIEQPELRDMYGKAAREWVVAERDWKVIAKRVDAVYRKLLGQDINEKAA